jgi:hypothetical protein
LPKAALKSFVRQAQLERGIKRGEETQRVYKEGKDARNGAVIEVVASSKEEALDKAAKDWGVFSDEYRRGMDAEPVRPYKQEAGFVTLNGRPSNPDGNYVIVDAATQEPAYRYMASDMTDATKVLRQWITANPETQWDFKRDPEMRLGQPGQQQLQGVDTRVDYELYSRASGAVIDTFPARNDDEARIRLDDYRQHGAGQSNPDNFGVRRAGRPAAPAAQQQDDVTTFEIYNRLNDAVVSTVLAGNAQEALAELEQFRAEQMRAQGITVAQATATYGIRHAPIPGSTIDLQRQRAAASADAAQGGVIDVAPTQAPAPQPAGMGQWNGQWKVLVNGEEVYRFGNIGNSQADANRIAAAWLRDNGQGVSGEGFEVYPVMSESLTETDQLRLKDFVVTISPHALSQAYNKGVDVNMVDDMLRNISKVKDNIMSLEPGRALILHNGHGTGLGVRRGQGNNLTLATVFPTSPGFRKGKHPTFRVDTGSGINEDSEQKPVTIYTNPANQGATVDDSIKKSLPVIQVPFDKLQQWESHKTMQDPRVADWVNTNLLPQLQQNGTLDPLSVWDNDGELFVIDGNHRFVAYQEAGYRGRVPVQIVPDEMITIVDTVMSEQGVAEGSLNESAVFLNPNTVVVGQEHGQSLELSPDTLKKVQAIAAKHGAYYEGNGTDRSYTKGQIDRYVGSWDDEVAKSASPNDPKWLYVLFANVDENNRVQRVGVDPKDTIFNRLLAGAQDNSFQGIGYTAQALQKFLQMASEGKYDFVKMSQQPATQENLTRFLKAGEALMWPSNWEQYPNRAGKIAKAATVDVRDQYLATRKAGVYVTGSGHLKAVQNITGQQGVAENFADGKNPGRKGLAKRSGVNTKASVSSLRKTAKELIR